MASTAERSEIHIVSICRVLAAVLAMLLPACSDTESRRTETLRKLALSNEEMETHIRNALKTATRASLRKPQLLVAHLNVCGDINAPTVKPHTDLEVVVGWIEDQPTVTGALCVVPGSEECLTLTLQPPQIEWQNRNAKRSVVFLQAFRLASKSKQAHHLRTLLDIGEVHVVLTRDGEKVSNPVGLKRWGHEIASQSQNEEESDERQDGENGERHGEQP